MAMKAAELKGDIKNETQNQRRYWKFAIINYEQKDFVFALASWTLVTVGVIFNRL